MRLECVSQNKTQWSMTTRRERAKPQINKQLEPVAEPKQVVNQRKEKLANFLIDVAKYVFTGVIITSLFNDVSDKTVLYVLGIIIVLFALGTGLVLTDKKKGN